MPWQNVTPPTQSWTTSRASAQGWTGSVAPVSEYRLEPVYPLPVNTAGDLDFVWRVQSDGYFVVATGNQVQIKSRITDGP